MVGRGLLGPSVTTIVTGAGRILALALAVSAAGWTYSGEFAPRVTHKSIDFLFFSPSAGVFATWWLIASLAITCCHLVARRFVPRLPLSWLDPLALLALPLIPILLLPTDLHLYTGAANYLLIDSRGVFVAVVLSLIVCECVRRLPGAGGSRLVAWLRRADASATPGVRLGIELLLAGVLILFSLLSSPPNRVTSMVTGDEPKYLRYLENWYQGRGMDITSLPPVRSLPPGDTPDLWGNVRQLGVALRYMREDLPVDLGYLVGNGPPGPRPTVVADGGWFVTGKRGGVYQVHNPGSSLLLFPGYLIDRLFLNWRGAPDAWFPPDLYFTNTLVLALYVLWGVAVFRLLCDATQRFVLPAAVTAVLMIALPSSAFAYQYYPEAAAGLFITVLLRFALFDRPVSPAVMAWYGFLTGYLPWLHVRFLLITAVIGVLVLINRRETWRAVAIFLAAAAVPGVALALYYYHVAGNPMPWALYGLTTDLAPFTFSKLRHLPILWFDRPWGLVGHAPIYLVALVGAYPAWRSNPRVFAGIVAAVLALGIPAAAHGLTGGGTTPLRLVAAAVPLLGFLVVSGLLWLRGRWAWAVVLLLVILSVQNAWTFSVNLHRATPWLQGPNLSGWLPLLLMPHFEFTERRYVYWVLGWVVVTVGLTLLPVFWRSGYQRTTPSRSRLTVVVGGVFVGFIAVGMAVAAATGQYFHPRFMIQSEEAIARLAAFHIESPRGGVRWSAEARGQVDITRLLSNPEGSTVTLQPEFARAKVGEAVRILLDARRPDGRPAWGHAVVDFGEGGTGERIAVFGTTPLDHVYPRPGEYAIRTGTELIGLPRLSARARVVVGDAPTADVPDGCAQGGAATFPEPLLRAEPGLPVARIGLDPDTLRLELDGDIASQGRAVLSVWLLHPAAGVREHADQRAADGVLVVPLVPSPRPGSRVCVMVVTGGPENETRRRTGILHFLWPPPELLDRPGVRLTPSEATAWEGVAKETR